MSFDDFVDWLDENPAVLEEFSNFLISTFQREAEMKENKTKIEDKKKLITKKKKM